MLGMTVAVQADGTAMVQIIRQGKKRIEKINRQTAAWMFDDEVDWLGAQAVAVKKGGWRRDSLRAHPSFDSSLYGSTL
jgi:hypothetical protein